MRIVRAGSALIALSALLVGVPWFLLQFAAPGHLLQVDWMTALTVGADSRLVLALLGAIGWVAWAVVALTVVFELIAVLSRQRIRLRLPGTGWLRPAVGALVLAAVAAPTVASADTGVAAPPLEAQLPAVAVSGERTESPEVVPQGRSYEVQPGDELWSVAEQELGSGERWRDIVALNAGLSDGSRLTPGTVLQLPEEPEPTVVVEEGDTLWHIAEDQLGDPRRWPELHQANIDQIQDPDLIDVGWELRLPASAQSAAPVDDPAPPAPPPPPPPAPSAGTAATAVEEAFARGFPRAEAGIDGAAIPGQAPPDPTTDAEGPGEAVPAEPDDGGVNDYSDMLLPVGAALAGSVLMGVATRRRTQVLARAVGRRLVPVPAHVARFWTALAHRSDQGGAESTDPTPTTLVLGWDGTEPVHADIEAEQALIFTGPSSEGALGAVVTSLACTPWASTVDVVVVDGAEWVNAFDDPRIGGADSTPAGLERLTRLCSERRLALRQQTLAQARADDDVSDAFAPTVVVFLTPLQPHELDAVGDALALGEVGVSVVAATAGPLHLPLTQVRTNPDQGTLRGRSFTPQLVTAPARRALIELFTATSGLDTEPAPWWKGDDDLPPNVLPLPRYGVERPQERPMTTLSSPPHPVLLLLGGVELIGTTGTAPTRAVGQCKEYCAWLLQHPRSTPTLMMRDLQVADATRRSNMSRLRTWLGDDPAGAPYLPDAYSGKIQLDERVTSDWEQFTAILSGGVNTAGTAALRDALALVRGEPLGSFAFQWHWAQQLHADMVAMIVDTACVLADRCLELNDLDTALWAIAQGRLGAPFDDALAVREIEALARSGRRSEAEHAVVRLNRALRSDGRDLDTALAIRVQEAMQPTARRARH